MSITYPIPKDTSFYCKHGYMFTCYQLHIFLLQTIGIIFISNNYAMSASPIDKLHSYGNNTHGSMFHENLM